MRFELIAEGPLSAIERRFPSSYPVIFTRRSILHFGMVGICVPLFAVGSSNEISGAPLATVAKYMFAGFSIDALVKISQEARAWCTLVNRGSAPDRQTLDSQIKNNEGTIEDEGAVNIWLPSGGQKTYIVRGTPENVGRKQYVCSTDDDERSSFFRVV